MDDTLDYLNKNASDNTLLRTLEEKFSDSMLNAHFLFGKNAFRKISLQNLNSSRKPLINKSLFTVWSVVLTQLPVDFFQRNCQEECLVEKLVEVITNDIAYFESLTTGTNQLNKLNYGFKIAEGLIQDIITKIVENAEQDKNQ